MTATRVVMWRHGELEWNADGSYQYVVDNANPIAEWCRSNVAIRTDVNGNIQPDKKNQDPRNRIDAWAAECDAFVVLKDMADEYQSMIGG